MRIALIADTHLSVRSPECVANWHAARRAVARLGVDLTVHLGDITLDGQTRSDELTFAARLMRHWPTETRCVPGNHDLGTGSGEVPLDLQQLSAYRDALGPDRWVLRAGDWILLGINAQLLGTNSAEEASLWAWLAGQCEKAGDQGHTALFLHRPLWRQRPGDVVRLGRYVDAAASHRLLNGPLSSTLRLVVSGHAHQYADTTVDGVRHLWMPSTAFILPDDMQPRVGEKVVGVGLLDLGTDTARFDLWCPDGMRRHDVSMLDFHRRPDPGDVPANAKGWS
jgi:3',5'-cyclic AMP phosphodiesterase CpdA